MREAAPPGALGLVPHAEDRELVVEGVPVDVAGLLRNPHGPHLRAVPAAAPEGRGPSESILGRNRTASIGRRDDRVLGGLAARQPRVSAWMPPGHPLQNPANRRVFTCLGLDTPSSVLRCPMQNTRAVEVGRIAALTLLTAGF